MFRGTGTPHAWRRVRSEVLNRDGYHCRIRHPGCLGDATEVHHLGMVRDNRSTAAALDPDRCVSACTPCHRIETQRQSAQARWSNRKRAVPQHPSEVGHA